MKSRLYALPSDDPPAYDGPNKNRWRTDGTATLFTHVLATHPTNANLTAFYFDNRNFRNREGDAVPYKDTTVVVTPRVNFGNDYSAKFVGRDSPQVATRRNEPGCVNPIVKRDGTTANVNHCGGVSRWDVASGGRMGMVFGEDATEVAPPATICTHQCKAQNRSRAARRCSARRFRSLRPTA